MIESSLDSLQADPRWSVLVGVQQRAQLARDDIELAFVMANDTWQLVPYDQACVFMVDAFGRPALKAISGLGDAVEDTPFTLWVTQVCRHVAAHAASELKRFQAGDLPQALQEGWAEWWPQHALYLPLQHADGPCQGGVLLCRSQPWDEAELLLLKLLHASYAFVLQHFRAGQVTWASRWQRWKSQPRKLIGWGLALALLTCFPVRLSVLAPAEIIALKSEALAAPMDGVIKRFHVQPNQPVRQGDLILSFDDTTLRNKREIASKSLAVAKADVLGAQQKAFDSAQSRAELAVLQGRVQERAAELAFIEETLNRIEVRAAHDGVVIYGDQNDWIGKPVVTGERLAQLAQPQPLGVQVWLPVGDAIALEVGASMKIYLQVAPLHALSGQLVQTSYQAMPSPDGVNSYRIKGELAAGEQAHIGLRGVAKVYGGWRPAIYWVMRRPLGALRQWIGL